MLLNQQAALGGALHVCAWLDEAAYHPTPFPYWLLENILPEQIVDALAALPLPRPELAHFDGRRAGNNASRLYFTPENQRRFIICRQLVDIFSSREVVEKLGACTRADLSGGRLRIEYCQDSDGFWLEPHCDVREKLFTMLIYLSDDAKLFDAGTDIYAGPPQHRRIASAPYEKNAGLIFIPGSNTWHGFSPRPINGLRKSLIINYVSAGWRAVEELA